MIYAIKIALRTLLKSRVYTVVSVLGLTLGLAACMLIASVVVDELSYDKHWTHSSDIYRLVSVDAGGGIERKNGAAYAGLAPLLKENFDEIEEYSTLYVTPVDLLLDKEDGQSVNLTALYTDSAVHQLLDIQLLEEDNLTPSPDINKIVISQKIADTYFKDVDAVGKVIYDLPRYQDKPNEYLVVGIMEDLPVNTHLRADVVMLKHRAVQELRKDGAGMYVRHYLLVKPGTDPRLLERDISQWYTNYVTEAKFAIGSYELQSIEDSYLKTDFGAYQIIKGNMQHIYIFSVVALMVLLIACTNFVNLSTARASGRLKDTGVRKILGASRGQLIRQFLLESLFTFGFATVLALVLYFISLPLVEQFIGHPLAASSTSGWMFFVGMIASVLLASLLSGLYPACFISNFNTDNALGRSLRVNRSAKSPLRAVLVTTQFSLSILILVAMLVVRQQVDYMKSKDTGIDTDGLISVDHISFDNKSGAFKNRLSEHPDVLSHSMSSWLPTHGAGYMSTSVNDPQSPGQKIAMWYIAGEPNLAETLGLELEEGRFLQSSLSTDFIDADDLVAETEAVRPCVITASTARLLDIQSLNVPIPEKNKLIPVGIVKDFNSESLHKAIMPTVIVGYAEPRYGATLIRTRPGAEEKVLRYVTQIWKEFYPDKVLESAIVKETLAAQYKAEEKIEQLFRGFSMLMLFLAALGLFGLIVNSVGLRTKEIGIRKVLGASVSSIVAMLSKDFVKLVLLAILIASPIAWWAMNKWLEDFAYRIDVGWWMFAIAGLLAILVALFTVSWQAVRAAMANPVDSLRDE